MATIQKERREKAAFSTAFLEKVNDSIYETLRARLMPSEAALLDDLVLISIACKCVRSGKGSVEPHVNEVMQWIVNDVRGKVADLYGVLKI